MAQRFCYNSQNTEQIRTMLGETSADFSPFEQSIASLQAAMGAGRLTAEELARYYLARIAAYDPQLNSMISLNPAVLEQARALDAERRAGHVRGPLHGIPLVVKDNINTADLPTTMGAWSLADTHPLQDAFIVRRLREAGALLLGKSSLSEFANSGMTNCSIVGQTLNPYDLTRTPGGSSGGTGAAVAANLVAAGLGTDGVNSVRSPASACCLVGLRPTKGLLSGAGICPASHTQDMPGVLARCVADAALLLQACAGYDPDDPATEPVRSREAADYSAGLRPDALQGRRLGLLCCNLGDDPAVLAVMEQTVDALRAAGAEVLPLQGEELESERLLRENNVLPYEQADNANRYMANTAYGMPLHSLREYLQAGGVVEEVEEVLRPLLQPATVQEREEYRIRLERIEATRRFAIGQLDRLGLDAYLYPMQRVPVVPVNDPRGQLGRTGILSSSMGLPAISVPGGYTPVTSTARLGVPVGVELLGRPFSEPLLLSMAYALEQTLGARRAPYAFPELPGAVRSFSIRKI